MKLLNFGEKAIRETTKHYLIKGGVTMKKYSYSVNNGIAKGCYTIEAKTKAEAIAKAKSKWFPFGGVNTSSFRVSKNTAKGVYI